MVGRVRRYSATGMDLSAGTKLAKHIRMGKRIKAINKPIRSGQTPATITLLYAMEDRLTHRIESGHSELKAEIQSVKSGLESQIQSVKSELKSDINDVKSELHRIAILFEEQNARNKYVMDGYAQLYEMFLKERKI